jgi:hypothetical protein
MVEGIDERVPAVAAPSVIDSAPQRPPVQPQVIKRTTPPETKDGTRWHVQLSAPPPRQWLEFFKVSARGAGVGASPLLVVFDQASASFKSDAEQVEAWIESLDRWIAATDARYRLSVDEADRERSVKLDTEAKQRERIQQLNERFKNL